MSTPADGSESQRAPYSRSERPVEVAWFKATCDTASALPDDVLAARLPAVGALADDLANLVELAAGVEPRL